MRAEIDTYFHVFFYDIDQEVIKLEDFFSVSSYPTTAIVDKDGIVIQKFTGFGDPDQYMTTLYHIIDKHVDKYDYVIPVEFASYQSDIHVSRRLVRYLLSDPDYGIGDQLGIFEDYFYHETDISLNYVAIVANRLAHLDEPRKWFMDNAEALKKEYGASYMAHLYEKVLEYEISLPKSNKDYKRYFQRLDNITNKVVEYIGEDE